MEAVYSVGHPVAMAIARPWLPARDAGLVEQEELAVGGRLPSIRKLAERFQVAIPTLREVLRRLQATGIIDIRHGSGIYVRKGHLRMMLVNPTLRALDPHMTVALLDARLLVEPQLAELAARIVNEDEGVTLQKILAEAEQYLVGSDRMLHRVNMSFHLAIARCTGNAVLAQIMESLIELYSFRQFAVISLFNARFQDHEEHKAIFDAVRDRDPACALLDGAAHRSYRGGGRAAAAATHEERRGTRQSRSTAIVSRRMTTSFGT